MAIRQVLFSDISNSPIDEGEHTRLVVRSHPATNGMVVELDVSAAEASKLETTRLAIVTLDIFEPNKPRRVVVLDAATFGGVFKDVDMAEVLRKARVVTDNPLPPSEKSPARGSSGKPAPRRAGIDYSDPRFAGNLHRGRVTQAEAKTVREELDVINQRLVREGRPPIDPADPKHKVRYGFGETPAPLDRELIPHTSMLSTSPASNGTHRARTPGGGTSATRKVEVRPTPTPVDANSA